MRRNPAEDLPTAGPTGGTASLGAWRKSPRRKRLADPRRRTAVPSTAALKQVRAPAHIGPRRCSDFAAAELTVACQRLLCCIAPAHFVGCFRRATTTRYNLALTLDRAVVCPAAVDDWSPSRWLSTGQDEPPLPQYDSGGQLGRTMTMAREHGVFGGGSDLANSPASPEPGIGSLGEAAAGDWRSSNPMAVDAGSTPGPASASLLLRQQPGAHDGLGMGMESSGGGGGGGALAGDGGAAGIAETAGQLSHVEAVLQRARNRRLQGAS
eukprot:COSAG04_NODE_2943_length_3361_cov_4.490497_2_plen_267_part_00